MTSCGGGFGRSVFWGVLSYQFLMVRNGQIKASDDYYSLFVKNVSFSFLHPFIQSNRVAVQRLPLQCLRIGVIVPLTCRQAFGQIKELIGRAMHGAAFPADVVRTLDFLHASGIMDNLSA
jgi:hypothetical protein